MCVCVCVRVCVRVCARLLGPQIFSGMFVQHTTSVDGTIDYLCTMHRTVTDLFADDAEVAPVVRTRHSAPAATIDDLKDLAGRCVPCCIAWFRGAAYLDCRPDASCARVCVLCVHTAGLGCRRSC